MNETSRDPIPTEKLQKVPYAAVCGSCGQLMMLGFAWLSETARVEDLRSEVESKGKVGASETCNRLVRGRVCGAANHITRDVLVFADDELLKFEQLHAYRKRG